MDEARERRANLHAAAENLRMEITARIPDLRQRKRALAALKLVLEITLDVMENPAQVPRTLFH